MNNGSFTSVSLVRIFKPYADNNADGEYDMIKQAKQLMSKWEDEGMKGFFMDFFAKQTGYEFGSEEYAEVQDLVIEGKI